MEIWAVLAVGLLLLVLLLFGSSSASQRQRETAARLRRVERKLDLVLDHLGLVDPEAVPSEVVEHLRKGQRIAAVRAYRQATGESLLEAKQAVDRIAEQRGL
ncbi:hypothetical protein [Plantactinospora sp. WMMB782]|uniref:hypothetical protein n=1 Tax=Plantactinospora sp. WMMB782 TaxID=3404121 RepID=UPI003B9393FA